VGELWIGGTGVGRGYWGLARQTAARFVPDPFGRVPGGRVYRTGDRARWRADGQLEFLGRDDAQIKLRGYRIELGEIEAVLGQCPGVTQCIAMLRDDEPGLARLVAYIVGTGDLAPVRAHARRQLPEYMQPSDYVSLTHVPLTPNGKVDRRALPAPVAAIETYAAPRTATEEILAGLWTLLLKRDRVGLDDNFFALGGHSLLATQLVSRARRAFGVELPLQLVFAQPTLRALAYAIDAARAADPAPPDPALAGLHDQRIANLLAELESLSDEQAEALLQGQESPSS
jgi:acyl carrier protein